MGITPRTKQIERNPIFAAMFAKEAAVLTKENFNLMSSSLDIFWVVVKKMMVKVLQLV